MILEIITPEAKLFSGEVTSVVLPGANGSFQLMSNHAPIISGLTKGTIKIDLAQSTQTFDPIEGKVEVSSKNDKQLFVHIKGGVIEMQNNKVIVLAE
jgi:F-type H+-transporting ATPase subunit epsilon